MASSEPVQDSPIDLEQLYRQHHRMVRRRVRRLVGDSEADELVQQAFEQAVRKQHTFRGDSSPVTWLYQIATRTCLHHIRDTTRRGRLINTLGHPAWSRPVQAPSAETITFISEVWRKLDAELCEVGTYHYVDGLTQAEIAQLLGCSRRTVGNRLAELRLTIAEMAKR